MKFFLFLCFTNVITLTFSLGTADAEETVSTKLQHVADSFDWSHERCNTIKSLSCTELDSGPETTLGEILDELGFSYQRVLELNGWSADAVTPETIVPFGKRFALTGSL